MFTRPKRKQDLVRELSGRAELPADHLERDQILRNAMTYLSGRNVPYVPLAIEEDIQTSYEEDTLEEFRNTVRAWMRELAKARKEIA